jgi:hypothetical protein
MGCRSLQSGPMNVFQLASGVWTLCATISVPICRSLIADFYVRYFIQEKDALLDKD